MYDFVIMKHSSFLPLVASLAVLSLVGLGCNPMQSVQDKVSQKVGDSIASGILSQASGGKVDVNGDNGNYTFKDNKTGASYAVGSNVTIPDAFPKDIPLYAGAKALTVEMGQASKSEASVTLQSNDDPQTVVKWYEGQLKDWKQASSYSMSGSEIRSYEKGTVKLSVTILQGGDSKGSVIQLSRTDSAVDGTQN